jgi:hypothetical protein
MKSEVNLTKMDKMFKIQKRRNPGKRQREEQPKIRFLRALIRGAINSIVAAPI